MTYQCNFACSRLLHVFCSSVHVATDTACLVAVILNSMWWHFALQCSNAVHHGMVIVCRKICSHLQQMSVLLMTASASVKSSCMYNVRWFSTSAVYLSRTTTFDWDNFVCKYPK